MGLRFCSGTGRALRNARRHTLLVLDSATNTTSLERVLKERGPGNLKRILKKSTAMRNNSCKKFAQRLTLFHLTVDITKLRKGLRRQHFGRELRGR